MEDKKRGLFGLFGKKKNPDAAPEADTAPDESASSEPPVADDPGADGGFAADGGFIPGLIEPGEDEFPDEFPDEEEAIAATTDSEAFADADPDENGAAEPGGTPGEPKKKRGLFAKFRDRLKATHDAIFSRMEKTFLRNKKVDDELFDELEEILITSDVGVATTLKLIAELRDAARRERREKRDSIDWLKGQLQAELERVIGTEKVPVREVEGTTVILIVGVNGTGKTTATGKLAHRYRQQGKKVLLVAADTFRAAAIDQLATWAERAKVDIVKGQEGADPGSVVFDAVQAAKSRRPDIMIIDTAGRLHTKANLMNELQKLGKIIAREYPGAPHETLLVLDASTGHNGLQQAKLFTEAVPVTGIVLTKLDGTAKGGVTIAVRNELQVPVKLVGLGEKIDDLDDFDPQAFIQAILN